MKNLKTYCEFLGLEKPVDLTLTTRNPKKWDAFYLPQYRKNGKLKKHTVTISAHANRNQDTLLMHELIHALQEEKGKTEIHGKFFRKWAKWAEKAHNLQNVFVDGLDK